MGVLPWYICDWNDLTGPLDSRTTSTIDVHIIVSAASALQPGTKRKVERCHASEHVTTNC